MRQDAFTIIRFLIAQIWRFFSEWYFPGTNVTPAGFLLMIAFLAIVIRFVKRITFTHHTEGDE